MIKNSIFDKQNEKDMLDILYAQRQYYNIANKLDSINLLLILIVCMFDFFEINNPMIKLLVNGLIALIIYIISYVINNYIKNDNKVLVNFKNGINLEFDLSIFSFENQIFRALRLENILKTRKLIQN